MRGGATASSLASTVSSLIAWRATSGGCTARICAVRVGSRPTGRSSGWLRFARDGGDAGGGLGGHGRAHAECGALRRRSGLRCWGSGRYGGYLARGGGGRGGWARGEGGEVDLAGVADLQEGRGGLGKVDGCMFGRVGSVGSKRAGSSGGRADAGGCEAICEVDGWRRSPWTSRASMASGGREPLPLCWPCFLPESPRCITAASSPSRAVELAGPRVRPLYQPGRVRAIGAVLAQRGTTLGALLGGCLRADT